MGDTLLRGRSGYQIISIKNLNASYDYQKGAPFSAAYAFLYKLYLILLIAGPGSRHVDHLLPGRHLLQHDYRLDHLLHLRWIPGYSQTNAFDNIEGRFTCI